jgi:hypothetical protein
MDRSYYRYPTLFQENVLHPENFLENGSIRGKGENIYDIYSK